jgi:hypothetical protein
MAHENMAAALAAFQAEAPKVAKDKTAKVPMKSGGQYSYQYADLADIAAAAYPLLSKHGLAFACLPESADRGMVLRGVLMHTSGERLDGVLPLHGGTPQEMGSALTYARRYLLGAMTGIVTDVDDDGALANTAPRARQRPPEPRSTAPVSDPAPEPTPAPDGPLTARTRGQMFALFAERGIEDADVQRTGMARILGRPVESRGSITEAEAQMVIASLRGQR